MKLEDLSKDDLLLVATQLASGAKIEDIEKIYIPVEVRRIAEALHTLFCIESHDKGDCNYFIQKSWTDTDRKKWVDIVTFTIKKFDIDYHTFEYVIKKLWEVEGIKSHIDKEKGEKELSLLTFFIKEDFRSQIG
jgi:hypothetical protein